MTSNEDNRLRQVNGSAPATELRRRLATATASHLPALRRELEDWAHDVGMPADDVHAIALASYEAMANVVAHAYRTAGELELRATYRPHHRDVLVTVADHGTWTPPVTGNDGGCGLPLIHQLAGTAVLSTTRDGTTVTMTWNLP